MTTRYGVHFDHFKTFTTDETRKEFLADDIYHAGKVELVYSHYDRFIFGMAVPTGAALDLPNDDDLRADYFLERRELGILNLGGGGSVDVDGTTYELGLFDCLYVSRGSKSVSFNSNSAGEPAKFYLNSAPAHREYPTTKYTQSQANKVELGDQ